MKVHGRRYSCMVTTHLQQDVMILMLSYFMMDPQALNRYFVQNWLYEKILCTKINQSMTHTVWSVVYHFEIFNQRNQASLAIYWLCLFSRTTLSFVMLTNFCIKFGPV